jgi:outer membrane protein OmpA-like peptidoglycan-associated protein
MIFKQGGAKLSSVSIKTLDIIAKNLNAKPKLRMQIKAYAGEPNISQSNARRLSLSRALAVRSYLIKKGIRSTRIDVRALGNKVASGAPNRADLKIVKN